MLHVPLERARSGRMDFAVLRAVSAHAVHVVHPEGNHRRVRIGLDVFVRRRNNRAKAQRVVGLAGNHGHSDGHVADIRFGLVLRVENNRAVVHHVPPVLHVSPRFRTYLLNSGMVIKKNTQRVRVGNWFSYCFSDSRISHLVDCQRRMRES